MSTLFDSYTDTDNDLFGIIDATYWKAQGFTATDDYDITSVKLKMYRANTPGTITVSIRADSGSQPTGADLTSGTTDGDTLTTSTAGEWREITFSSTYSLVNGTKYHIVVRCAGSNPNIIYLREVTPGTYSGGVESLSSDSGTSWAGGAADDAVFETYGNETAPADKWYSRSLIAIGGREVWYESTAGTMAEVTDANGDTNPYVPLEAVEAYQKLFIVNRTNLKVLDMKNSKITTTDAGANPCTKGMTLTGASSSATMVVDYADGVTDDAAANVYGLRTSTATFTSGETVTGTNGDGNAVSFVLSANEDAAPHWYNWTVFGNDTTTYGTMPTSSTLVALYHGRLVINDIHRPHAWYMSKVEDPWKFLYDFTNDRDISAVTYAQGKVGDMPDILTAFCPIGIDLLVFGCANSVHLLIGDPLSEGQITELTGDTGIWGARAWCLDDNNNFYFVGNGGLYRCRIGESVSKPENISKIQLPNLLKDWDLDKSTHRLILEFDPVNRGLLLEKTTLDGGDNDSYWFDLTTEGFFPETYPDVCGIYSMYFYPATDETYKKFLLGCQDGYIREFDNSTKNDATTASTSAISSYCLIPFRMGSDSNMEGMLTELTAVTAGGASNGDFSDTDTFSYSLYKAKDAETLIEDVIDGATAFKTGTWTTTGKQNRIRTRMRGVWGGIKLSNSTASRTWAINSLETTVKPKGKL